MPLDEKLRRELEEKTRLELARIAHKIVYDLTIESKGKTVRIKYPRDIRPRMNALPIRLPSFLNLHRIVFDILKSTPALKQDPDNPREFTTNKREFIKFYIKKYLDLAN